MMADTERLTEELRQIIKPHFSTGQAEDGYRPPIVYPLPRPQFATLVLGKDQPTHADLLQSRQISPLSTSESVNRSREGSVSSIGISSSGTPNMAAEPRIDACLSH